MNALSPPFFLPPAVVAQAVLGPDTDAPPATSAAPLRHTLTFSDFQTGLRDYNAGKTSSNTGTGVLVGVVAVVILTGVFLHLRQRRRQAGPPDSDRKLARELLHAARLSWPQQLLLLWVGRSTHTPVAALLISSSAFDSGLSQWASRPTFAPARRWGKNVLETLRPGLFT